MADPSEPLLLQGLRLWDGRSDVCSDAEVEIRTDPRGLISDISDISEHASSKSGASDLERVDLAGAYAIPGLIDAHVHLTLDPTLKTPAEQFALPPEQRERGMRERAERMLRAGITTARDLGGGEFLELALRDEIAAGLAPGPRLLCAGQPITSPGGHCHFWGGEAANEAEGRAVVRRQVDAGCDLIKLMATGGVFTKGSKPWNPQFDATTLRAFVREATSHGRHVAAHCHGTRGISDALHAGVRTIEHCSFAGEGGFGRALDRDVLAEIGKREVWVSPTVNSGWGRRAEKDGVPTEFFERMSAMLRAIRDVGGRFISSTDAGIPGVEHDRLADGMIALAKYAELAPIDVLRSATSESANALGLESICGMLAPGFAADLVVFGRDPTRDLSVLREPLLVIARGRVIRPEKARGGA